MLSILAFVITYIDMYTIWKTMFSVWKIVIINIAIFLYILILFKGSLWKRMICYLTFNILLISTDIIAFLLVSTVNNIVLQEMIFMSNVERVVGFCIARIIFVLLGSLIIYSGFKNKALLPLRHWIVFLIVYSIILIFADLVIFIGIITTNSSIMNMLLTALVVSLLLMYFCTYYLFIQMGKFYQRINENNMLEYQNELIEKYILQKEASDKIIRILSHDLKHNLLHWKQLAESKGYSDVLTGITEYEQTYEANLLVDVENDIANAIINQKLLAARKNEIQFDVKGIFSDSLSMSSIDLCSLVGNLLDNAIEACENVKDTSKRRIFFSIKRDGSFLFLEVVNSYEIEPVVKDNIFITRKRNRLNHGIGMLSINSVVEKYEGAIENTFQNDEFKSIIMLRAYE